MKKKQKKDVLFLCQFFYPEYVSSATLPYDTALALSKSGMSVGALCGYPKEYSNGAEVKLRECVNGIEIHRLKYLQLKRSNFIGRLINYFSFTFSVLLHFYEMKNYKTVIVYSNPPILPLLAAWAKKKYGTKLIFVAYDLYPEIAIKTGVSSANGLIYKVMNYVNEKVYKNASRVIALSNEMKHFIEKNRDIDSEKVVVIPNWYKDCEKKAEQSMEFNSFYEKYKDKLVVSYLGNMGTCQDMETILDAIRMLKEDDDIQFMFAGHGNKMKQLKETVESEKLSNVVIYDFLHGQKYQDALSISGCSIISLYSGLTGLCVPSKTYGYMMAGTPIIAIMGKSDIVRDIEENKMGYAVNNGDANKLASSLLELKNHPEFRKSMGKNSRNVFLEKYTTEKCTHKYIDLLKKI